MGADVSSRCWTLTTVSSCSDAQACLATLVRCIDTASVSSTSSTCETLRSTYKRDVAPQWSTSQVKKSCENLVCTVFASLPQCNASAFGGETCNPPTAYKASLRAPGRWEAAFSTGSDAATRYVALRDIVSVDVRFALGITPVRVTAVSRDSTDLTALITWPNVSFTSSEMRSAISDLDGRAEPWLTRAAAYAAGLGGNASGFARFGSAAPSADGSVAGSAAAAIESCDDTCLMAAVAAAILGAFVSLLFLACVRACFCRKREQESRAERFAAMPKTLRDAVEDPPTVSGAADVQNFREPTGGR